MDALQIADMLSLPYEKVYKTLVTVGNSKNYYVFVIPIAAELDLKKAAKSVGEKAFFYILMLHNHIRKLRSRGPAQVIRL